MDVYVRQVEIIKQINSYTNNNKLKKDNYNDTIYVCSRHLKVINDFMVRNYSGRLFRSVSVLRSSNSESSICINR